MSSYPENIGYPTKPKQVIKTGLFRRLFPRLPSEEELTVRKEQNIRHIVTPYLGGGAIRGYLTEADVDDLRKVVLDGR